MSQIIKTNDFKNLEIITDSDTEGAQKVPMHGTLGKILATSNGTLVRVLNDAGRLQFVPIVLVDATINPGSQANLTHDELEFTNTQDWILISNSPQLIIKPQETQE